MAKVQNVDRLIAKLQERARRAAEASRASVVVGYTQAYALYVHENLEAYHPVGQAKFLEQPAREHSDRIGQVVKDQYAAGRTMTQSLVVGGLLLQRESQMLVPVDTGALRNSAFTEPE